MAWPNWVYNPVSAWEGGGTESTSDYAVLGMSTNQEHTITCCCYVTENITETALNLTNKMIKKELAKFAEVKKK